MMAFYFHACIAVPGRCRVQMSGSLWGVLTCKASALVIVIALQLVLQFSAGHRIFFFGDAIRNTQMMVM